MDYSLVYNDAEELEMIEDADGTLRRRWLINGKIVEEQKFYNLSFGTTFKFCYCEVCRNNLNINGHWR